MERIDKYGELSDIVKPVLFIVLGVDRLHPLARFCVKGEFYMVVDLIAIDDTDWAKYGVKRQWLRNLKPSNNGNCRRMPPMPDGQVC